MPEENDEDKGEEDVKKEKKKIKSFKSSTREAFFADAFSVLFNRGHFMLDMKQNVPNISVKGGKHRKKTVTFHRPVVIDPVLAKKLQHILSKNIKKYEDKYGEIKLKEREKKDNKEEEKEKPDLNYIG